VGEQLRDEDRRPRIVVVDDDPDDLALLHGELGSRYARDYVVVARSSPVEAITVLERLRTEGQRVVPTEHTAMRMPPGAARPPGSRRWCGAWPGLPPVTATTRTRTALSLVREDQHQTEPESNGPDGP
jgi:CheY-like chemotaxis protein